MSEHVFAEALSATITCLHCGKASLLGSYRKRAGVHKDAERFVIVESFLRSQMIERREDVV